MNKNYLLLFMILCYLIPIFYVLICYNNHKSVSNIICDKKIRNSIIFP